MKQSLTNGASVRLPIVLSGTSRLSAMIYDGITLIATLEAEAFNSKSELRLDAVLATMVKDTIRRTQSNSPFNEYGAHNISARVNGSLYRLLRYVKEPNIICTGMPTITKYNGFELTLPIWNRADGVDISINGSHWIGEQDFDEFEAQAGIVSVIVSDTTDEGIVTAADDGSSDTLRIQKKPAPEHPFYLRWLNEYGGWDYWMFSCRQKVSRKLTANEYYEPYDSECALVSFHKEVQRAVEVSSGVADKQTLEVLAYMPESPDIRLYKKDTQEWVPIRVENGDTEIMSDQSTGELVFSFVVSR